jgi:tetratricopeptide (TPR) repeat protein
MKDRVRTVSNSSWRQWTSVASANLLAFSLAAAGVAQDDDQSRFAHTRKTVVPASRFKRHYDDESVSGVVDGEPNRTGSGASRASTSKSNRTTSTATSIDARIKNRIQPLLNAGKFDDAQTVAQAYMRAYPRDKSLRAEFVDIAQQNAERKLQQSLPQAAASLARQALDVDPTYEPARATLSKAITKIGLDPADSEDRLKMADQLSAAGRYNEAAVEYGESLRIKPSAQAHIGLGDAKWREGKKESAKVEYERALAADPQSNVALRQLGIMHYQQGDIIGASDDLSKALMINPTDKAAASHLVELWRNQVTHNPNAANSHLGLGRAYQLAGDLSQAQSEYRQVVRLDPLNPKLPQARRSFKIAMARQEAQHAFEAAHEFETRGMLREAQGKAYEAANLFPTNIQMRLYHAQLSQKLGYYADAQNSYLAVLKQDPNNELAAAGLRALPLANANPPGSAAMMPVATPPFLSSGTPSVAPNVMPVSAGTTGLAGGVPSAVPSQGASAAGNGSPVLPAPDPSSDGKMYSTSTHVQTLANFFGQLRDQTMAAQQAGSLLSSGMSSSLGSSGLLGGGLASTAGALPPVQSVAMDTSGVNSALSQAASALKAAGVTPTMPTTTTAAVSPMVPALTTAQAMPAAPPGVPEAANAVASVNSQPLMQLAMEAFPQLSNLDPNTVSQLAARYAPLLENSNGTELTPEQLNALYKKYRVRLEKELGMKLPPSLNGPSTTAPPKSKQSVSQRPQRKPATVLPLEPGAEPPSVTPVTISSALPGTPSPAPSRLSSAPSPVNGIGPSTPNTTSPAASAGAAPSLPPESALRGPLPKPGVITANQSATNTEMLRGFIPPSASATIHNPVRLELLNVNPTANGTSLNVSLKNASNAPLTIPANTKAVVELNGKKHNAKVLFASQTVPANGELRGTIELSGQGLPPSTDLWIPNILPGAGTDRNLHLSVTVPGSPM